MSAKEGKETGSTMNSFIHSLHFVLIDFIFSTAFSFCSFQLFCMVLLCASTSSSIQNHGHNYTTYQSFYLSRCTLYDSMLNWMHETFYIHVFGVFICLFVFFFPTSSYVPTAMKEYANTHTARYTYINEFIILIIHNIHTIRREHFL